MKQVLKSRRKFIKKAIYKAPVLFLLGSMSKGVVLYADASGGPSGPPGGFIGGGSSKKAPRKRLKF